SRFLECCCRWQFIEKSPQDALTIIENKSKVLNSRSKPIASPVNACDNHSSSELPMLTHAVNQQTSVVTTAMTAMLKQFQSNPPPAQVKAVKEICVTLGATGIYNQGNPGYRPQGVANQMRPPGPTVPNPPKSVNPEEDECVEETYTDPDHVEYTIKQEKDDIQIQKFWNTFKQLHLNITLAEALVLMPEYQKMLKALLSNKEKLQELANTPLNENCSAVILKKLPEKLGDPGKFLIPYGFSLTDLIPTRMTLELANRAICTPDGITRDVFVSLGKFTFPADFVVVDYESDHIVPLILGGPLLRTARALIDVHDEEMILHDGDKRLTLNMKHDIASYSNHPRRESVKLMNIFNIPSEDCLEDLVSNKQCGNPTLSLHKEIASPEVIHEFDVYPDYFLEIESDAKFDNDSFNSEGEKIKEAELLIDQLDLPCDILLEYDSFASQDFSRDDVLPSPDNEDKVFNPGILIHKKSVKIITCVSQGKKLAVSFASWLFEDFDPPFYELFVFKEVSNSMRLLPFSSENKEKVFKLGIYSSKKLSSIPGFMKILANGFHYLKSSLSPLFNLGITYP
nr:hypothetical protein [Tanacetum cinerariifolium]